MGSHSPSASGIVLMSSNRCSERPSAFVSWREPSPEEYRRTYEHLDKSNPAQQTRFYQPHHRLEYDAQGLSRDVTDSRSGPLYEPSPASTSAIRDARSRASIESAGLSNTGIDCNGLSSFRHQDPGRFAAKSNQTSNGQNPRKYGRAIEEGPVSSSLGTSKGFFVNHTHDFQHASSPGEPFKDCLS